MLAPIDRPCKCPTKPNNDQHLTQSGGNLTGKLPSVLLLELAMGDDVVQHLSAIDVFEDHVVVMGQDHDLVQTDNVWVMQDHHD